MPLVRNTRPVSLFDEAEQEQTGEERHDECPEDDTVTVPAHSRKKVGRKPLPDHLPRVREEHDIPDEEKVCPCCQGTLHRMGEEISEQLDIIPAKVQVIQHVRPKYACRTCEDKVKTAPLPPQPIPRSIATPGLLAYIITSKYVDGLPLYRLEHFTLARLGVEITRATMATWVVRPKKTGKAHAGLALIQKLYRIEREIKESPPDDKQRLRQQRSLPILDRLRQWLEKSLLHVPPKSLLGKALHYLHNQWDKLVCYCDEGYLRMDNNLAENAIRPFVVGRKAWLFSNSERGARASANLYSLVETAKACGREPYAYLKDVFTRLPAAQTGEDIEQLLPWNINSV